MRTLSKIFITITLIILVFLWNYYIPFLPNLTRPSLDKTCNLDSDCEIESADFCASSCRPDINDIYNKVTVTKIKEWRGNPYRNGRCPIHKCLRLPIVYIPKCINNQCIIEKSINCTRMDTCKITDTHIISIIEKEFGYPISEIQKTCNCI